jgi:hypothetical protein
MLFYLIIVSIKVRRNKSYSILCGSMLYDWGVYLLDKKLWIADSKIKTVFAGFRIVDSFTIVRTHKIRSIIVRKSMLLDKPFWLILR